MIIGGDSAATRKAERCLAAGALVTVVAETLAEDLQGLERSGRITWQRRRYRAGDLSGAAVAYASVREPAVVAALRAEAERERVWLNVIDDVDASSFFAPAVITRGELQIAIGTGGASPGMAARLRRDLEARIGPEYAPYVAILGAVRRSLPDGRRAEVMSQLVDSELLALVRRGERAAIDALLARVVGEECTLGRLGVTFGDEASPWT